MLQTQYNPTEPLLRVENLKKYFSAGKHQILKAVDDVSFSINRGETLGLVGESGCGKTTVGRTILRLYEPDGGHVFYEETDLSQTSRAEWKAYTRKMQMVFQAHTLPSTRFSLLEKLLRKVC